jgi:predicted RNA-binding protein with PIN domain
MMKEYIIDGNNLIHKNRMLVQLQKKDRQLSREKLAYMLDNFFISKNVKVILFYDGFENLPIKTGKTRIMYSGNSTADSKMRKYIEESNNPRNIVAVSSDDEIKKLARACGSTTINSEEFSRTISKSNKGDDEEKRINGLSNDEFKKLFGVDED